MKTIVALLAVASLTGCSAQLSTHSDYATLSGSPEGIRSMMDGFQGLIINGKASPDKTTAHTIMRGDQEREISKRSMTPSFLSNLLNRNSASNVTNVDTGNTGNQIEDLK